MGKRVTFWLVYLSCIGAVLAQFQGRDTTRKDYGGKGFSSVSINANAGVPGLGGRPTPTPSGPVIPHVADANARLSIDPTGKVAGYRVIQDDLARTYEFSGAGLDSDAGVWVSGAGDSGANSAYISTGIGTNGRNDYTKNGIAPDNTNGVYWDNSSWTVTNAGGTTLYTGQDGDVAYPWLNSSWGENAGDSPPPTVIRDPIASEANWSVVP